MQNDRQAFVITWKLAWSHDLQTSCPPSIIHGMKIEVLVYPPCFHQGACLATANWIKVKSVASQSFLIQTSGARLGAFIEFVPDFLRNLLDLPPVIRLPRRTCLVRRDGWTQAAAQKVQLKQKRTDNFSCLRSAQKRKCYEKKTQGEKLIVFLLLTIKVIFGMPDTKMF